MGNWTKNHIPCPDQEGCGSTDAASVCADGSIYCFACRRRFNTNAPVKPQHDDPLSGVTNFDPGSKPRLLPGSFAAITSRRISERTCRLYDYQIVQHRGKTAHAANYKDEHGLVVCQHIRQLDPKVSLGSDDRRESSPNCLASTWAAGATCSSLKVSSMRCQAMNA